MARDTLDALREEAVHCMACPLYRRATQTVFGEGPARAKLVLVGEQPGDQEDIQGKPFVGPAGLILDRALGDAGIDRGAVYVTNAVKHFKFERRGKRRIHAKPGASEIGICSQTWLARELAVIEPDFVVALGATAAQALSGKGVAIGKLRGREAMGGRQARARDRASIVPAAHTGSRREGCRIRQVRRRPEAGGEARKSSRQETGGVAVGSIRAESRNAGSIESPRLRVRLWRAA